MTAAVTCVQRLACVTAAVLALLPWTPHMVHAQAQFTASVAPNPVTLTAGGGPQVVRVTTTPTNGFRLAVSYTFTGFPAGLTTGAEQTAVPPYPQNAFSFQAAASVAPGTYSGSLIGSATTGTVTVPMTVVVVAPPLPATPVIHSVSPPTVNSGTTQHLLRLRGANFAAGALITSVSPGVRVTRARVLDPSSAEVEVAVHPHAPAGSYRLELRNPDGASAAASASLIVQRAGSPGAPLAVTAVRVLAPRSTQIIAVGERVHAHALLATSGMGTVVGSWLVDGVPFERFTRVVTGGMPLELRSRLPIPQSHMGEHRLELAIESPHGLARHTVLFFQARDSRTALRIIDPVAGAVVRADAMRFRWTLVPGAASYEIELAEADAEGEADAGRTPGDARLILRRRVDATHWQPSADLIGTLGTGMVRMRVRAVLPGDVLGAATAWTSFTIVRAGDSPDEPSDYGAGDLGGHTSRAYGPAEPLEETRHAGVLNPQTAAPGAELLLSLQGAVTSTAANIDAGPSLTRLQLSAQTDGPGRVFTYQATGDLSGSHDLGSPWDGREESRHWIARFGTAPDIAVRPEATIGYTTPTYFDRTELLAVAGAHDTGVQGGVTTPFGSASFYHSVNLGSTGNVTPGGVDISAAALDFGDRDRRVTLRAMALQATDEAIDGLSAGGVGRAAGALVALDLGPSLQLLAEAAIGEYDARSDTASSALDGTRAGAAFRLGVEGRGVGLGYGLRVGHTAEGFVNPANRGFTPGGVSGLTRAELTLDRAFFGRIAANAWLAHTRGGATIGTGDPQITSNSARLSFALPVSAAIDISISGNATSQHGDPFDEAGLPGTDRAQRGIDLGVNARVGVFSINHSAMWQDVTDRIAAYYDQQVAGMNLSMSGPVTSFLALSAGISATRINADSLIGTTDQWLVTVQPSLHAGRLWLELAPRIALSHTANSLEDRPSMSTHYGVAARWGPPWAGALITIELASDWTRNRSSFDPAAPFARNTLLTLGVNWRADRRWGGTP